jgi:hypothetical protein
VIEDHEAPVKAKMAVREVEIVDGTARESRFNKLLKVVAPVAKTTAQRKHVVGVLKNLKPGDEF